MVIEFDRHNITFCADTGIYDSDMYCAGGKVAIGSTEPESGFGRPVHVNFVCQVDDVCFGSVLQDRAFHDGDKRAFLAEICR
jgi:hypothetical protein